MSLPLNTRTSKVQETASNINEQSIVNAVSISISSSISLDETIGANTVRQLAVTVHTCGSGRG